MRNFTTLPLQFFSLLCALLLCAGSFARAESAEPWSAERCAQLRQLSPSDVKAQQQLQQYCAGGNSAEQPASHVMPVQLDLQLPATAATANPKAEMPPQRVQHNSTLEMLGSTMLLVLVGFWLWMGRK
jgi:hypothetical protein